MMKRRYISGAAGVLFMLTGGAGPELVGIPEGPVTSQSEMFNVEVGDIADYLSNPDQHDQILDVFGDNVDGFFLGSEVFKNNVTECQKVCFADEEDADDDQCVVVCGNGDQ